jgi:hypothetical protein
VTHGLDGRAQERDAVDRGRIWASSSPIGAISARKASSVMALLSSMEPDGGRRALSSNAARGTALKTRESNEHQLSISTEKRRPKAASNGPIASNKSSWSHRTAPIQIVSFGHFFEITRAY